MQKEAPTEVSSRGWADNVSGPTDEALAGIGDTDSFIQLYHAYLTPIYRYLYARLGNRHEAEDVTSAVFERAWGSISLYKPTGSFRGWLFTIAHRTLADYRRSRHSEAASVDDMAFSLADPRSGPEDRALMSERLRIVLGAIAELSVEQQEIVCLRFMAELRYSEIATITGKSEAAAKMAAYRALEQIRRRYSDGNE